MSDRPADMEAVLRRAFALDAPLNERLALVRDGYATFHGAAAAIVERLVARLEAAAAGEAAPRPGEPMPPFLLPDDRGRLVSLAELHAEGPVAIVFHRGHWCPYCRLTADALGRIEAEVAAMGARLAAITPERRPHVAQLKGKAGFPVLTDLDNAYAVSLNLAIWVGAELEALLRGAGRDLAVYQGNPAWLVPVPATFIVGRDGVIRARHVDPDYRRRIEMADLLQALRDAR